MDTLRDSSLSKRSKRGFLDTLLILVGGIGGGAVGWHLAQDSLAHYAAKAGHLGPDSRGPVILGYLFLGWAVGTIAAFLLDEVWRRARSGELQSRADDR